MIFLRYIVRIKIFGWHNMVSLDEWLQALLSAI